MTNSPTPPEGFRIVEPEELRRTADTKDLQYCYQYLPGERTGWTSWPANASLEKGITEGCFHFAAPSHPAPSEAGQEPVQELLDALGKWFAERERKGYMVRDEGEVAAFKAFKKCQELNTPRPAAQPTPKGTVEVLREVREALEFYASSSNRIQPYFPGDSKSCPSATDLDCGRKAQAALTKLTALLARLESEGE